MCWNSGNLVQEIRISPELANQGLKKAVANGQLVIVKFLLDQPMISTTAKRDAIVVAA